MAGAGGDEDGAAADGAAGFDVHGVIADEERTGKVYIVVAGGLEEKKCPRLTAEAAIVGVVGAVVDVIDLGSSLRQKAGHLQVYLGQDRLGEVAAGDTRLVGDDDQLEAMLLEKSQRFGGVGEDLEVLGA